MKHCYYVLQLIFCIFLLTEMAYAQVGNCTPATSEAYLDVNNVRARIFNDGGLFWRGSPHIYEVPKGLGSQAVFTASVWIAGLIDGKLHGSAARFGKREFWPGPLGASGNPPDDCSPYDRLWEINEDDLSDYRNDGMISDNLLDWPWQLGAPVVDGDGDPNNYNLSGGDEPQLQGHERLWWVMNDRGNVHESSQGQPIGLEVQASAFAFNSPPAVSSNTFYSYKLIYNNSQPLTEAYFTLWLDVDLGNFADDYVGSDSLLHLGYFYNADSLDEGGEGYGSPPPAIGFTFIKSPLANYDGFDNDRDGEIDEPNEMLGTTHVLSHQKGGGIFGEPDLLQEAYFNMQSKWQDGSPLLEGGQIGSSAYNWPDSLEQKPTRFSFSGDPVTGSFWSEYNIDGRGLTRAPADRRLLISTGPFSMNPGDSLDFAIAIVWARGKDHLDSVTELKKQVVITRDVGVALLSTSNDYAVATPVEDPAAQSENNKPGIDQNFPNPFSNSTTLRYSLSKTMQVRLAVYDVLGREVVLLVDAQQRAGTHTVEFDAGNLPPGTYLARIELDHLRFTKRMVLIR